MSVLAIRNCRSQESTIKSYSQKNTIIYNSALALFPFVSHRRSRLSVRERTYPQDSTFRWTDPVDKAPSSLRPSGTGMHDSAPDGESHQIRGFWNVLMRIERRYISNPYTSGISSLHIPPQYTLNGIVFPTISII